MKITVKNPDFDMTVVDLIQSLGEKWTKEHEKIVITQSNREVSVDLPDKLKNLEPQITALLNTTLESRVTELEKRITELEKKK